MNIKSSLVARLKMLFFVFYCLAGSFVFSQGQYVHQTNSNPNEQWFTFFVHDVKALNVAEPPGKEQTQKELTDLKQKNQPGEKALQQIRYWDAGSPAYRWNQLGYSLLSLQDFPTFSRTPTAWMNIAINDAMAAAWTIKYKYMRKRPAQLDPALKPIVEAPATPSYPCEHTVAAAAAAG